MKLKKSQGLYLEGGKSIDLVIIIKFAIQLAKTWKVAITYKTMKKILYTITQYCCAISSMLQILNCSHAATSVLIIGISAQCRHIDFKMLLRTGLLGKH